MMLITQLQRYLPRRRKARWLLGILLGYAVLGFLVLPPIVRVVAVKQLTALLDRKVSIRSVRLNPFTFAASVHGLVINEPDGQPFVSCDDLYVNLQLISFVAHPWVLGAVRVNHPFVHAQMNRDGSFNFSDLITKFSSNSPPVASPGPPLSLHVGVVRVTGASGLVSDMTPSTPFHRRLGPIDLTLRKFRTDPNYSSPLSFSGATEAIESIHWKGSFGLSPLQLHGDFALTNMALKQYIALYHDLVRFEVRDGLVTLQAGCSFDFGSSNLAVTISNAYLSVRNFKLGAPGNPTNLVEFSNFSIRGMDADVVSRFGKIDSIDLQGANLHVEREADGNLNLVKVTRPIETGKPPGSVMLVANSITNIADQLLSSTNTWTASLHHLSVTHTTVQFSDVAQSRPVQLDLHDIQFEAANLSNLPGSDATASAQVGWSTNGSLRADLSASLRPIRAEVRVALDHIDLHPFGPYLESWLNVIFLRNNLSLHGTALLTTTNSSLPEVTFRGDCELDGLSAIDGVLGESLLDWSSVRLSGIEASLNPLALHVNEIAVNDAAVSVVVDTNHTVNLLAALRPPGSTGPPPGGDQAGTNKPVAAIAPDTNSAPSFMPEISVGSVVISNASVHFIDRSVSPAVNAAIQPIQGTISELSSEALGHAAVHLDANIDTIGHALIQGTINPFAEQKSNDVTIAVQNVDLLVGSTYSGKYAGYRIARGKLAMDLAYHLRGRNLKGENKITLDHFTFGDKVDSPDATSLPVRLGVALLKDRNGQIQLDVPVDGSLDDPDFRIRKVILHTIVNLLARAATSPFSLLGSLFGGQGEEVRYQVFAPGHAELSPSEKSKLDALAHALYERPGLQIEIQGSADPVKDRDGLRVLRLEGNLRSAYWSSLGKSARAATSPDLVVLTPEDRERWIKKLYARGLEEGQIDSQFAGTNGASGPPPPPSLYQSTKRVHGATRLMRSEEVPPPTPTSPPGSFTVAADPFEQALLNSIAISDADFESLAADRTKVVRDYLLQAGKVEPERIYLSETRPGGLSMEGPRTSILFR